MVDFQRAALLLGQCRIAGGEAWQEQARCDDCTNDHLSPPASDGRLQVITLGSRGYLSSMTAELEAKRVRLAELGARHDLAMSAFKFEEPHEVQQRISLLEWERGELVDALPTPAEPPPATSTPVMVRRRRLGQRRRRPLRR